MPPQLPHEGTHQVPREAHAAPPPAPDHPTREDGLFASLWRAIPKHKVRESRKNAWITADMWRIDNKKVSTHQDPTRDQAHIRRLGRAINASLREDRQRQTY